QLALGGAACLVLALAREGEPVPRLGKRDEVRAPAGSMGGQHRADTIPVGVGADDDVVRAYALEHGDLGVPRQAVDRQTQLLNRRWASPSHRVHRLAEPTEALPGRARPI